MATKYVNVDRQTPMLLPPDVRDWVANNDLAHFVLEAVESTDLGSARVNVRGTGDAQYPPALMLALLIYSYATGTFSSRAMERDSYDSLAVRYLCANHHPDHDTIAKFRRENGPLLKTCFIRVLELARELGLLKLGTISVDGTKIAARANKKRNLTAGQIAAEMKRLELEVEDLLARAETADREGGDNGTRLPKELADRTRRMEQLRQAQAKLEERKQSRNREKKGKEDSVHPVEPGSGLMPTAQGPFVQGYNVQAAVSAEGPGLILGRRVTDTTGDRQQLVAVVETVPEQLGVPEGVLSDTGYDSDEQIEQLRARGMEVLCPPQNVAARPPQPGKGKERREVWERRRARQQELKQPEVRQRYGRRAASSEPCFHVIKCLMGFGRFMLRGLEKVSLEWDLVALAYNCRKIAALRA